MSKQIKLLFLLLGITVLVLIFLVTKQILRARKIVTKVSATPLISNQTFEIPLSQNEQILGNPGALLTVVEFVDLGDQQSKTMHQTLANFVLSRPMAVRLIWEDLPANHFYYGDSALAHQAAWCAAKQNKFWEFINAVMTINKLNEDNLLMIGKNLKLNQSEWWTCAQSTAAKQAIAAKIELAKTLGVSSAPALFVNNKKINLTKDLDLAQMLSTFISP